jgi:hypothetical protein
MAGRVEGKEALAVEKVDRAGGIDAERKRPAAAGQSERDMAQGAVAADRADVAHVLADVDRMGRAAFGEQHLRPLRLEPGLKRGEPVRAMAAGRAVVEELDGRAHVAANVAGQG